MTSVLSVEQVRPDLCSSNRKHKLISFSKQFHEKVVLNPWRFRARSFRLQRFQRVERSLISGQTKQVSLSYNYYNWHVGWICTLAFLHNEFVWWKTILLVRHEATFYWVIETVMMLRNATRLLFSYVPCTVLTSPRWNATVLSDSDWVVPKSGVDLLWLLCMKLMVELI